MAKIIHRLMSFKLTEMQILSANVNVLKLTKQI